MARHEPLYRIGMGLIRALFTVLRVRKTVVGISNLPDSGGAVLAMTHFGYLEFALVAGVAWMTKRRRIRFLATKSAFSTPIVGWALRATGQIPVDLRGGADAYAHAVAALLRGELIGIFPEAGVDASYTVRALKTGAVRLAREADVPLVPIAVWGGQRLLTKNHRIGFFERFGVPVTFAIGAVVELRGEVHEATARLRDELRRLVAEAQTEYADDGTGKWWQPRQLGGTAPTEAEAAEIDRKIIARRDAKRR
ncbi:MAG TPA: lysophospholipid acyltransferase family protein [Galbitalea sp.]|jgi:1-acyl-sn-glycerol-3-phosphate acyltransferase